MDGLLGFDPEQLKALMAQFGQTPEDRQSANKQAAMALGFGLLQGRKGNELATLGQAGFGAMGARNAYLADTQKQRQEQLAAALSAMKAGKEMQFQQMFANELGGGAPAAPAAPATVPGPSAGAPPMSAGFGGSSLPSPGAPAPAAPAAPSAQPGMERWMTPRAEMLAGLGGHKDVADIIHRQLKLEQGPSGTLMRNGQVVGQVIPNYGMIVDGKPTPLPKEVTDALVSFDANKAAAVKGAELPYQLDTAIGPTGAPQRGYVPNLYGQPPVPGRTPPALPPQFNLQGQSPEGRAAMLRDVANPQPDRNGVITGMSPIEAKAAEEAITTQEQGKRAQQNEVQKNFATTFNDAVNAEYQAPAKIAKLNQLKGYLQNVETGKMAPAVLNLKSYAAYVAPDLAKEWTKDVPFAQAAQQLSNEMALQLRNPAGGAGMPGSLSDADRDFLTKLIPNIGQDPRAMPMAVDAKIALAKREQQIGQLARDYRRSNGQLDEGFYQKVQEYSDAHPLFSGMTPPSVAGSGNVIKYDANGKRLQ